jgi:hypothetical protein
MYLVHIILLEVAEVAVVLHQVQAVLVGMVEALLEQTQLIQETRLTLLLQQQTQEEEGVVEALLLLQTVMVVLVVLEL